MKTCILLGAKSDIGMQLMPFLEQDYKVVTWSRGYRLPIQTWDLVVCMIGRIAPVGPWELSAPSEWEDTIDANLNYPIRQLRSLWHYQLTGSAVCFFAGSNPNMIMDGYSAYNVGKMALLKAVEQIDHESQDCKVFALGPGIVLTKIHEQTGSWTNTKLEQAKTYNQSTPIWKIHACLKWCLSQPKNVVGGRNICVSDPWGPELAARLALHPHLFKLRRAE